MINVFNGTLKAGYGRSQRIVSKLGDWDSYGADPRRIAYAGADVDGAKIDYKAKYTASRQAIKDRYAKFEVEYYGRDNDDYVNGGGFCCDDSPRLRAGAIGAGNDNPETFQYYYHSDHLGSTSLITNLDGEIAQHVEYLPFGEVFLEERNNRWNTPFLFNAKELDGETGLYYYGARYYDPRTSVWLSTDPLQKKYPDVSTYAYCGNNPINAIDPDGRIVIPIHGTWSGYNNAWQDLRGILTATRLAFNDENLTQTAFDWSGGNYADDRTQAATSLIERIKGELANADAKEPVTLVGHSHGGNVAIEAINAITQMEEFKDVQINLLTINTPVRQDYQLSEGATKRVNHVNVYDSKDPIQINGGNSYILKGVGEVGKAGRTFDNAYNVIVDNPQNILQNFHNSHNRTIDWTHNLLYKSTLLKDLLKTDQ